MDAQRSRADLSPMTEAQSASLHMPVAGRVQAYAGALAMVAISTLVGLWIAPRWGTEPIDMVFLPAVLAAAALWGIGPGVLAGLAAALAYNFFFTEPIHTFRMNRVADIVTVVVLLFVALVTSRLASGIRSQARLAAGHAKRNATIAGFAGRLLSSGTKEEIATTACTELHRLFEVNAMMVRGLPEPRIIASAPLGNRLTPSDIAAAALTLQSGQTCGRGMSRIQPAEWQFHPVCAEGEVIAAIALARDDGALPLSDDQLPLLSNLLDQLALALERARAEADRHEVTALRERDSLRSALLSSVGHDLRTPLTAIIGAAGELGHGSENDAELVATLRSESAKLERYISNLLDMARIEAGAVKLKTEPVDLVDAVAAALKDVRTSKTDLKATIDLPAHLPLVSADASLLHHCLINLIDNALRYSADRPLQIGAIYEMGEMRLSVANSGPGLPQDEERALDAFMRMEGSDRKGGAGLGLAIVKGFAEAMGVSVTAANRHETSGAIFTLRFPKSLILEPEPQTNGG